jgi:hypothetical protein
MLKCIISNSIGARGEQGETIQAGSGLSAS